MPPLRFVVHPTRERRSHCVTPDDLKVVLGRLPEEVQVRLREVHLNDCFPGCGCLGYANWRSGCLSLCALPPRVSFGHYLDRQECTAQEFGAQRGRQWPRLAVRRFVLYYVFLHELGHLQAMPYRNRHNDRIPGERLAREFGHYWRRQLWSQPFDHPDLVHNPPGPDSSAPADLQGLMNQARYAEVIDVLLRDAASEHHWWHKALGYAYHHTGRYEQAVIHLERAWELAPGDKESLAMLGTSWSRLGQHRRAACFLESYLAHEAGEYYRVRLAVCYWLLGNPSECERVLREGLSRDPESRKLNHELGVLLKLTGRHREARPYVSNGR